MAYVSVGKQSNSNGIVSNYATVNGVYDYYYWKYTLTIELAYDDTKTDSSGYHMYSRYTMKITDYNTTVKSSEIGCQLRLVFYDGTYIASNTLHDVDGTTSIDSGWIDCGIFSWEEIYLGLSFRPGVTGFCYSYENDDAQTEASINYSGFTTPTFQLTLFTHEGEYRKIPYEYRGTNGQNQISENDLPTVERSGYSFLGWDENEDATTPHYAVDSYNDYIALSYGGTNLYAIWAEKPLEPQDVYVVNGVIYAKDFVIDESLDTVQIDVDGNVYAAKLEPADHFGVLRGTLYALDFETGEPPQS